MSDEPEPIDEEITVDELLSHLEFGCWTAIVLIPVIYLIQGPSVSRDQLIMRSIVTGLAVIGAPTLTMMRLKRRSKAQVDTSATDHSHVNQDRE